MARAACSISVTAARPDGYSKARQMGPEGPFRKGAAMAEESTFDRIVKIVQEQDGLEDVEITTDTVLTELGLDSLAIAEAIMSCEDEFGIEFDGEEIPETFGDLVDMVDALA